MSPERSAFLSATLRFLTLHFDPNRLWTSEYQDLQRWLRELDDDYQRGEWERRSYRRTPMLEFSGILWSRGKPLPGQIRDISATGVRLDELPRPLPSLGEQAVLTLHPPNSILRVDLPTEIVRCPAIGSCCLQFRGMPLLLQKRRIPAKRRSALAAKHIPDGSTLANLEAAANDAPPPYDIKLELLHNAAA